MAVGIGDVLGVGDVSGLFNNTMTVVVIMFALGILGIFIYVIRKWLQDKKAWPVYAHIFEQRGKNVFIREDKARRVVEADAKVLGFTVKAGDNTESYVVKDLNIPTKPVPTDQIYIDAKGGNHVYLWMSSKSELIPLSVDKAKGLLPQVPEEAKLWWLNSVKKKTQRWTAKVSFLMQILPYAIFAIGMVFGFMMLQQTSVANSQTSSNVAQAAASNAEFAKQNEKVVESMDRMTERMDRMYEAMTGMNIEPVPNPG